MNRFSSLVALGVGAAAFYSRSKRGRKKDFSDMFSKRSMKRMRKRVSKAFR
ncbi:MULTISPECIES: YrzQ family protein [Pontibacillus]|uniref:YrzQ family protein n=1 Tax=Pontibacillus chungwhensis TaxID=265426 RepID=A0ABY8UUP7_9BACI|nr:MULTISPECIES: YrzQ family protein [Pontibacillus]MCD5323673.1 YrzQ family protein [Pontibacillus sp. HN14]WIF97040.1 YrzQ family protein [Pontibacillus chungwhensis]